MGTNPREGALLLSRARTRRFAACSVTCVAGVALAGAPAAKADGISISASPLSPPSLLRGPKPLAATSAKAKPAHASRAATRRTALRLINRERARNGRRGLASDRRLARAAARHAADMARRHYFGHVSPGGMSPMARARAAGWHGGVGEAIAWGCGSLSGAAATVHAWMASPPHRAILLSPRRRVGIGFKRAPGCSGGRVYWVADVG
jgi:uncharacterized protein YkwD